MEEKIKADELLSEKELDEVAGGNIIQTKSMLSILNDLGVPGIPENLRLEGEKPGYSLEASQKLKEILSGFGIKFDTPIVADAILDNTYMGKNEAGSWTRIGASEVISRVKAQIVAQTTAPIA